MNGFAVSLLSKCNYGQSFIYKKASLYIPAVHRLLRILIELLLACHLLERVAAVMQWPHFSITKSLEKSHV